VRPDEYSEPHPDLTVLRVRDYRLALPGPEGVLLLIEVSDTTLTYDRGVKLPLYARAGIREVWIVDLSGEVIERHTGPSGYSYRHTERARGEDRILDIARSGPHSGRRARLSRRPSAHCPTKYGRTRGPYPV